MFQASIQVQDGGKKRGYSEPPSADEKVQSRATAYNSRIAKTKLRLNLAKDSSTYNSMIQSNVKRWSTMRREAREQIHRQANLRPSKTSAFTLDATYNSQIKDLRVGAGQVGSFLPGLPRFHCSCFSNSSSSSL